MRIPPALKYSVITLAAAAAVSACGDARATEAAQADLKRDLELASTTVSLAVPRVDSSLLSSLETRPNGTPELATVVKRAPSGTRAVRSRTPTVRATPVAEVAAVEESDDAAEVVVEAPAPEETSEPVAVAPRPQPTVIHTGGTGDYGSGNGGVYGDGGGTGVVIRGGGVDGDNCELHRTGGRRGGGIFVPIGIPRTSGYPQTGGTIVNRPRGTNGGVGVGSRNPGTISRSTVMRSASTGRVSSPRMGRSR